MARKPQKPSMRDYVLIYVNGQRHCLTGEDVFRSLSDFLRIRLGLVGTKIVCSEGDCGACTVLVGRPGIETDRGELDYATIDSCILFMFQLDGCHVISVEGLKTNGELSPVQRAMVDCHASQCGFCTPGFVMSMVGVLENTAEVGPSELRRAMTGNLCRCTGYTPIIEAGLKLSGEPLERVGERYPPAEMIEDFRRHAATTISVSYTSQGRERLLFSPTSIEEAVGLLAEHPEAKIVAGATDVGVQINKGGAHGDVTIDLNRVAELEGVRIDDGKLIAGARATWTELEHATEGVVPEFHQILTRFGSPQIRNIGTLGGNIANASPIADSLPFLFVCEAEVELQGPGGVRRVNINDFYQGYKQTALEPGELIVRVSIPLPRAEETLRLYKVSKRWDLDIASFTAAILVQIDEGMIARAAVAFGAVGPTVFRARRTEAFLTGRSFSEETMRAAGDVAVEEVSPISDVRGSREYRYRLTRNVLVKFYHETQESEAAAAV